MTRRFLVLSLASLVSLAGCGSDHPSQHDDDQVADTPDDDLPTDNSDLDGDGAPTDDGDSGDGDVEPPRPKPITNSANAARDGWYPDQPGLNPAIVAGSTFGRRFDIELPGAALDQVYAQPLYFENRVLVATEANNVYSIDSESGAVRAAVALGEPWAAVALNCSDLVPTVGITGTPVIDPEARVAYLLSKTYDEPSGESIWLAHALDTGTLAEKPGFPLEIRGVADNDPTVEFNAEVEMQRPGLLLMNGVVYAAFGGHCDIGNYSGWIVGFTPEGTITAMFATEAGPDAERGSGIWQSGAGLMSDGDGRIFFVTGNSFASPLSLPTPGHTPPGVLNEAMARVDVQPDGTLRAMDFFVPYDVRALDDIDADFGSGGPVALADDVFGTPAHPHVAVAIGKAGVLYVFDRDNLGGYKQAPNGDDLVLGRANFPAGAWSRPGIWPGDGGLAYFVLNNYRLVVAQYAVDGSGNPNFATIGTGETNLGYTSGSPIITSDGTTPGSALVWAVSTTGAFGDGELRAYDTLPDEDGVLHLRYADAFGPATKFFSPGVGDGRLYVGTLDGHLICYGAPATSPVTVAATDFGTVVAGNDATRALTIRANQGLTLESITSSDTLFDVELGPITLPRVMAAGDELTIDVTFAPDDSGLFLATLAIVTTSGNASASLRGNGQTAGPKLVLGSPFISFGGVTTGDTFTVNVVAKNAGAQTLTFSGVDAPDAPFFTQNVPVTGSTLLPGASVTFSIGFQPTAPGSFDGYFELDSNGGNGAISMSGTAANRGHMVLTPNPVSFGNVQVGETATRSFTVSNDGGTYIVIAKSKPPIVNGFSAGSSLDEGTRINPGQSRSVDVRFAPTTTGAVATVWTITASDGQGVQDVVLNGTGTP